MTFISANDRKTKYRSDIEEGGSKLDLMLALCRLMEFVVSQPIGQERSRKLKLGVMNVAAEDGSGESWIVKGDIVFDVCGANGQTERGSRRHFRAYYRTDTRKGLITIAAEGEQI